MPENALSSLVLRASYQEQQGCHHLVLTPCQPARVSEGAFNQWYRDNDNDDTTVTKEKLVLQALCQHDGCLRSVVWLGFHPRSISAGAGTQQS